VVLDAGVRGVAVNAAGEIFGASWDGNLYRFDASGMTLDSIGAGVGNLTDVDLAGDGRLVAGSRFETVVFSNEALDSVATATFDGNGATFVAFARAATIFADGFESGDTSAWSATVP
jgi:hypothetical protein